MNTPRFIHPCKTAALIAAWAFCAPFVSAETFTLTDKQGRSIKADVLSVTGDQVKIKRDDSQTFNLSLATLSDDDQKKLKAWAEANPPKITAADLVLQFSRAKFNTDRTDQEGMTAYKEEWGYNIELSNKHGSIKANNLRAEYILYIKQDGGPRSKEDGGMRRVKGAKKLDPIGPRNVANFRTEPILSYRYVLKDGYVWSNSGLSSKPIRDTLEGMWLRIYSGDELLIEKITPETLAKTEKW